MATKTRKTRKSSKPSRDVHQEVTDRMVEALEAMVADPTKRLPWNRPWDADPNGPRNGVSNRPYSGMNVWLCWISGYSDPRWYTFKQAKALNNPGVDNFKEQTAKDEDGNFYGVRKGEKSTGIVHWSKRSWKKEVEDDKGNKSFQHGQYFVPFFHSVFNHAQINWAEDCEPQLKVADRPDPREAHANAQALVDATGAKVQFGGNSAFYSPIFDHIGMPPAEAFKSVEGYWGTMLHELVHWTGHSSRMNRGLEKSGGFGSESYAAEELVAEMGASMLCMDLGVEYDVRDDHVAYVQSWIKALKNDKKAIFTAASKAKKAMAFIKDARDETLSDEIDDPTQGASAKRAA